MTHPNREELAGRLIGFAVHDDDCTVNRFPGHDACSCGLSALIQEVRHAAALRQSPTVEEVARVIEPSAFEGARWHGARKLQKAFQGDAIAKAQAIDTLYKRGGG